jgi:hypothetical protein
VTTTGCLQNLWWLQSDRFSHLHPLPPGLVVVTGGERTGKTNLLRRLGSDLAPPPGGEVSASAQWLDLALPGRDDEFQASAMLAKGAALSTIGRVLGHRQMRTVLRYSHIGEQALLSAVQAYADSYGVNWTPAQAEKAGENLAGEPA